jgi:hypothetical protein
MRSTIRIIIFRMKYKGYYDIPMLKEDLTKLKILKTPHNQI